MAKQLSESQRGLQAASGELPTAEDVLQTQPAVTLGQLWAIGNSVKNPKMNGSISLLPKENLEGGM